MYTVITGQCFLADVLWTNRKELEQKHPDRRGWHIIKMTHA